MRLGLPKTVKRTRDGKVTGTASLRTTQMHGTIIVLAEAISHVFV